jgi:hypothetical protein
MKLYGYNSHYQSAGRDYTECSRTQGQMGLHETLPQNNKKHKVRKRERDYRLRFLVNIRKCPNPPSQNLILNETTKLPQLLGIVNACNSDTQKTESEGLYVQGQLRPYSKTLSQNKTNNYIQLANRLQCSQPLLWRSLSYNPGNSTSRLNSLPPNES